MITIATFTPSDFLKCITLPFRFQPYRSGPSTPLCGHARISSFTPLFIRYMPPPLPRKFHWFHITVLSTNNMSLRLTTLFSATSKSTLPVIPVDYSLTGPLDFAFATATACIFVPFPDWVSRKFVSTLRYSQLPDYTGALTNRVNSQFPMPDSHRLE